MCLVYVTDFYIENLIYRYLDDRSYDIVDYSRSYLYLRSASSLKVSLLVFRKA